MSSVRRGFTLMELLVVVSLIALAGSIVGPYVSNFQSGNRANAEAAQFVACARSARYYAMANQATVRIAFSDATATAMVAQVLTDASDNVTVGDWVAAAAPDAPLTYKEVSPNWKSILEEDVHEFDDGVQVTFRPVTPPVLFFRSDGTVAAGYLSTDPPIGVFEADFKVGEASTTVQLSPAGALESTMSYEETY